ncbi:MAG: DNA-binding protein [Planctomycetota bacterium]|nr:MAG: DNA-binding protein [Planctomycetota bacterium]
MAENQYYDFEKALHKLSLEEEDLKRLISAGEIRAFRDGSQIRLRAEDVERVAKDLGVSAKEEAGEVLEVEEVLFSESAKDDQGMVTTQLSEEDTLLDDGLEVVEVEEEKTAGRTTTVTARPSRAALAAAEKETKGTLVLSVLTLLIMVYGLAFLFAAGNSASNGITDPVVNLVAGKK